jgi:hypothetical protein
MNSITHFFRQWDFRMSLSPQEFKELLLSHHPNLPCFDDDVIVLFNRRICAGCLLAYPIALGILLLFHPSGIESIFLALALAVLSQTRRLSKNIIIQHFCRIIAGVALGFGIGGGYWALTNGQWLIALLLILGAMGYMLSKACSMKNKLINCNRIVKVKIDATNPK